MAATQLTGTQLKDGSISDVKVAAGAAISSTKLADGGNFVKKDGAVAFTADQSMGGNKLTNLAAPIADGDAATKSYTDSVGKGLRPVKDPCRVATTANIVDLVAGAPDTVDGVSLVVGDRVLVKDQTTGSQNGIYVVDTVGTGVNGAWSRATDADADAEVKAGLSVFVTGEGATTPNTRWVLTTNDPITVGTTALTFTQFSGASGVTAGAGMTKTGDTLDVVGGDGIVANADDIAVVASAIAGSGLEDDGSNNLRVAATVAGSGLSGGGGLALSVDVITRETPSGVVDGVNAAFTLANTPVAGTEHVYLNGVLQEPGGTEDYTISGSAVTFVIAPVTGDKIRVSYFK